MTRIDFYILSSTDAEARCRVVCKLIDKATTRGQRVFVHSDDTDLLQQLDECLWSYRPDRFIAHELVTQPLAIACDPSQPLAASASDDDLQTVTLSCQAPTRTDAILINLASQVPVFFSRFERTLEVVDQEDENRLDGRTRYRFYQERGYPLQHHNL
jgi:DNA polymerase III subunit chi